MLVSYTQRLLRKVMGKLLLYKILTRLLAVARPTFKYTDHIDQPSKSCGYNNHSPIFINGRFRSGSTLVWQMFERLENYTAYYEPLHERKWFDPNTWGSEADKSHRGTSKYHGSYETIGDLSYCFDEKWSVNHLAMGAMVKNNKMTRYIKALIDHAPQQPVLQFNRTDFRLPYLRRQFPDAFIIHLYRDPRKVWESMLRGRSNDESWRFVDFEKFDNFYLSYWYRDLSIAMPWIIQDANNTHPYFIHYMIWQLSQGMASHYADYLLSYERLCEDFEAETTTLFKALGVTPDLSALKGLMEKPLSAPAVNEDFYESIELEVGKFLMRRTNSY